MPDQRHPLVKYNPVNWFLSGGINPEEVYSGIDFRDVVHPSLREADPNMSRTPFFVSPPNLLEQLISPLVGGLYSYPFSAGPPWGPHATLGKDVWSRGIREAEKYPQDGVFHAGDAAMHELGHMIDSETLTPQMRRNLQRIIEDTEVEGRKPYANITPENLETTGYPPWQRRQERFTRLLTGMGYWPKPEEEGYQEFMEHGQPRSAPSRTDEESMKHFEETGEFLKEAWVPEPPQGYPYPGGMREGNPLWEFMRTIVGEDPRDLYLRLQERLRQVPLHLAKQQKRGTDKLRAAQEANLIKAKEANAKALRELHADGRSEEEIARDQEEFNKWNRERIKRTQEEAE
jgi:hypothetical protein